MPNELETLTSYHDIVYDARAKKSSTARDASPCETALSGSGMYREVEETCRAIEIA